MKYMLIHCIDEAAERSGDTERRVPAAPSIESWLFEMEGRGVLPGTAPSRSGRSREITAGTLLFHDLVLNGFSLCRASTCSGGVVRMRVAG